MTEQTPPTWWVPTAPGVRKVAHLLRNGPHKRPHATTVAACGERRQTWEPQTKGGQVPRCADCARAVAPRTPEPNRPGTWWAPTSIFLHAHKKVRAHLLPDDATGARGSALCGEIRAGWQPIDADAMSHCAKCEIIGNGTGRRAVPRTEARSAALVAASYCLDRGLGGEDLRELLSALLDNPGEARRAS